MTAHTTTERLLERYNHYNQRPTLRDGCVRTTIYKAFRRSLGGWLPRNPDARILDIACGEGALLSFLRTLGYSNLSGFDLSAENVEICHSLGLGFVRRFDALRLAEFSPGVRYDAIFALDILEHLPKQWAVAFLEQARALLAPRGCLVLQTPNMGSVLGLYHRYLDVSHEFGLTERSAASLLLAAGFSPGRIEVRAAWSASTPMGRIREVYLRLIHRLVFLAESQPRPKIPTKNLLIRGSV